MKNKVIINQSIIYDSASASLYNLNDPDKIIILTTPANNCLQILIKNRTEITTQKELFTKVWESHGIPVTANTLYQNIALIRKAIRQLGNKDEFIITIPRRGMLIAENVHINDFSSDEHPPPKTSINYETNQHGTSLVSDKYTYHHEEKKTLFSYRFIMNVMFFLLYILLMTCTSIFTTFVHQEYQDTQSRFYSYRFWGGYHQCPIYVDSREVDKIKGSIEESLKRADIKCNNSERVYASFFTGAPRESFIFCDGDILKTSTQCRSKYQLYIEG
ncbi:transcriptional regulator [Klebsiella aerogenes]|uniref:transcriptional regulator n=1 Tax=Klebsiella aerogenes TaxID=548 RepID=UPI0039675EE8